MQEQLDQVRSYLKQGQHKDAVTLCHHLLEQQPNQEECVLILDILTQALRMGNNLPLAETVTQSLLTLLETNFETEHSKQASVLQNLALIQSQQTNYQEASKNAQKAVHLLENTLNSTGLPHALVTLSSIYYESKNFDTAKIHIEHAMELWEKSIGHTCFGVSTCLNNLGRIYEHYNDFDNALACHAEAVNIRRQICGKTADTAFCLGNYGGALAANGQFKEAATILQEALNIYTELGLINTPYAQTHQQNLDLCLRAMGKNNTHGQ